MKKSSKFFNGSNTVVAHCTIQQKHSQILPFTIHYVHGGLETAFLSATLNSIPTA